MAYRGALALKKAQNKPADEKKRNKTMLGEGNAE